MTGSYCVLCVGEKVQCIGMKPQGLGVRGCFRVSGCLGFGGHGLF